VIYYHYQQQQILNLKMKIKTNTNSHLEGRFSNPSNLNPNKGKVFAHVVRIHPDGSESFCPSFKAKYYANRKNAEKAVNQYLKKEQEVIKRNAFKNSSATEFFQAQGLNLISIKY
jgi:hypothetical protein